MANKVLLENQSLAFSYNSFMGAYTHSMLAMFTLTEGETYKILWDGTEYERVAFAFTFTDGSACIGLGNTLISNGVNNGDVFVIIHDTTNGYMHFASLETKDTHTVGVYQEDVQYIINGSTLTAIANSIRAKTGTTGKLSPGDMPEAIEDISGGGGGSADSRVKYVTFMDGETELIKYPVIVGDTCKDPVTAGLVSTPTKESTAQYNYTYSGWSLTDGGSASSSALANVTEDRTVYAAYSYAVRYYTVTYYDEDGVTVLKTESLAYGSVPSYKPAKEGYLCDGWIPELSAVTGDASYTVKWIAVIGGNLSDTITWVVDIESRELRIEGTGAIPAGNSAYHSYSNQIDYIIIGNGITEIGSNNFKDINAIVVIMPNTLQKIGYGAFYRCSGIHEYEIPEGVTEIGPYAFYGNSNLSRITLPSTLTTIKGSNTFYQCTKLKNITIPENVTKIGDYVFSGCTSLTSAVFENTQGWYVNTTDTAAGGTSVDVSNPTQAATHLVTTHLTKYWNRI